MRCAVCVAAAVIGCGGEPPTGVDATVDVGSPACAEATAHSDLTWIQDNVFTPSCVFSSCHSGGGITGATRIDLRAGRSHAALVDAPSEVSPGRSLVTPDEPARSFLLVMLGQITPAAAVPPADPIPTDIGTMPQGTAGELLCPEIRGAIERWIAAGAQND